MNAPFRVVLILISVNIYSQSLTESFQSTSDRSDYIKMGSIVSTADLIPEFRSNKKVIVSSIILNLNKDNTIAPIIAAKIKISWNLSFTGRLATYATDNRTVQSFGWGLMFKPGNQEDSSPWKFSIDSGSYRSFQKITSSTLKTSIYRLIRFKKYNLIIGYSASSIKANDYSSSELKDKYSIKENISFISAGTMVNYRSINVVPRILINSNMAVTSIEFQKQF